MGIVGMVATIERLLNLGAGSRSLTLQEQLLRRLDPKDITAGCTGGRDLLPEEAFRAQVRLEGRRAERSRISFVLFLLDVEAFLKHRARDKVVEQQLGSIVAVSTRTTDLVGWHSTGKILGVVFTEVSVEKQDEISRVLRKKVVRALYDQLGFQLASKMPLAVHVFSTSLHRDDLIVGAESVA